MQTLNDYIKLVETERSEGHLLFYWTSPTQALAALRSDKLPARKLTEQRQGSVWSTNTERPKRELVCLVMEKKRIVNQAEPDENGHIIVSGEVEDLRRSLRELWLLRSNQKNMTELAEEANKLRLRVVHKDEAPPR